MLLAWLWKTTATAPSGISKEKEMEEIIREKNREGDNISWAIGRSEMKWNTDEQQEWEKPSDVDSTNTLN